MFSQLPMIPRPARGGASYELLDLREKTRPNWFGERNMNVATSGMQNKPTGIALFCGAGGLSLGFEHAGFHIATASDIDKWAAETYQKNHPNTTFICADISSLSGKDILETAGLSAQDVDVVFGGPPCQGFSLANAQSRLLDNPNNRLFREFIRIVEELQPPWFLMENVPGLLRMQKGLIKGEIENRFGELGYRVWPEILCAADYGAPQIRQRIIFVGNRTGQDFQFPVPSYHKLDRWKAALLGEKPYLTVDEAISDLPKIRGAEGAFEMDYDKPPQSTYQEEIRRGSQRLYNHIVTKNGPKVLERYKYIPPGANWMRIPEELMVRWRNLPPEEVRKVSHSSLYKRLDPAQPSITIANFRKSMYIHPYEDRGLSVREAARLQSFPDTYVFYGPKNAQQQQVANAVPPQLARPIAEQIRNAMILSRKVVPPKIQSALPL